MNQTTSDVQKHTDVAIFSDGSFVAVWDSLNDGSGEGVFGRFFDSSGSPPGGEFRINQTTLNQQLDPAVALAANGNFVVAWTSTQGGSEDIYARVYNSSGTALTNEVLVNTGHTIGDQQDPDVAVDNLGNFVVVWDLDGLGDTTGVFGQRLFANGTLDGEIFRINNTTLGNQDNTAVAMGPAGNFVVTWTDRGGSNPRITGQRFNSSGVGQGEFAVQAVAVGEADLSSVAMDDSGNFVIAWGEKNADISQYGVRMRRFDVAGASLSGDVLVNTTTNSDQFDPAIAMDSDGDLVISWTSVDQDGDNDGVVARAYRANGTPDPAGELLVNTYTTSDQHVSQVAIDDIGKFVVSWEGQSASDLLGVYGRLYSWPEAAGAPVGPISDTNGSANAVNENAANGTVVGITAFASDPDDPVTYSLDVNAGGRFAINASTGVVTVANSALLNREAAASHNITVRATSADTSFSTQGFTISLNDLDEFNVGAISDTAAAANAVNENAANGTTVGITAFASDADATTNAITYSLDDNAGGRFAVNATTGVVTVANSALLNREAAASHNITVRATSADTSFSTQGFTISLNDLDEFNVGAISDTAAAANAVNENAANGTTVGITAFASDADATTSVISYSLDDDAGGRFAIDSATDLLTVNGLLDYEAATSHDVTVRATSTDTSFTTRTFTIAILDLDEFDITAISDTDAALDNLTENASIGTVVGVTAFASDADAATNTISYTLDDDAAGQFAINGSTGVVTVAGAIDREAGPTRKIIARATSADGSTTTRSFVITINDIDEFDITAISDTDAALDNVTENASIGTVVGTTAFASDADAATNTISYTLDDDGAGQFVIDGTTGVVTVAEAIDREAAPTRTIIVRATSADGSTTTQSFNITINDLDEFDITAISDTDAALDNVNENAAIGTVVGVTAFASDADATTNTISYTLDDDAAGQFAIDGTTGVVSVAGAIDREAGPTRTIIVRATSADGSTVTQSFNITINDLDEFDITAISDTDAALDNVTENAAIGSVVGVTAFASDADATTNTISYTLDDDAAGRFAINATTGEITAIGPFEYIFNASHVVGVRANSTDGSTATATFVITINQVLGPPVPVPPPPTILPPIEAGNDSPPVIDTPPINVDVEDLPTRGEPEPPTNSRGTTEPAPSPVSRPLDDSSQESPIPTQAVSVIYLPVHSTEPSEDTAESPLITDDTSDEAAPMDPPIGSGDSSYAHLQRRGAFWKGLDEVRQAVDDEIQTQTVFVGAALATASGLSAGYVIWLARSGVLLTSLLAQLPSWRLVDPLVILDYADDRRRKDACDDETLEDVIATSVLSKNSS